MKPLGFSVAATLVLVAGVSAQQPQAEGSIRGVVQDQDFDAPVPGADVLIVETGQKVKTSDQGGYVFSEVKPGTYTLMFSKDGYVRQVKTDVVVTPGKLSDVDIVLAGDFTDMEEFVVQDALQLNPGSEGALLNLRFNAAAQMDSVSADVMSRAGASDAASALRLVAGASVKDGKSAVIRGLPDRYVSSQLNGVRLPSADEDKRAVELDQFPASVIESIQVAKTFTPDQQGDASGGAVNVRLKGIPDQPFFFNFKVTKKYNSQVADASEFLGYRDGGVNTWGRDDGRRAVQWDNLGYSWDGAVGTSPVSEPDMYKWSFATGGMHEFDNGLKIGGSLNGFYERDASFRQGVNDSYWVETPGGPMVPETRQGTAQDGDFKTALFDVTQASQSVQWGGLASFGLAIDNHSLNFAYLYSRTAEDTATLNEDTRGKQYFFPGYDPYDPSSPGYDQPDAAPYLRMETLEYSERVTDSLQISGRHAFPELSGGAFKAPELDWTLAKSSASLNQPDKRQFGSVWKPARQIGPPELGLSIPANYQPFKPAANFTLGNVQRIYKKIDEDSNQYFANLRMPFDQWNEKEGYLKFGIFHDRVERQFDQETFSNFGDNTGQEADWGDSWSAQFPYQDRPISESDFDVDYEGDQEIGAWYAMVDLPLTEWMTVVGGVRFESTSISVVNDPEDSATWLPPGGGNGPVELNPGDADAQFDQDDVLPSLGFVFEPFEDFTIRTSYNQTVARPTFKELTPILQQEFLGSPIFIGNPDVRMSAVTNYDLRFDYRPTAGSLFSLSWFRKDIDDPIEYVQKIDTFSYTTAENYPEGQLNGWEFEVRKELGELWSPLSGLMVGGNATLIDSEVELSDQDKAEFEFLQAPMSSREMTAAPDRLLNLYLTYDFELTNTRLGLFYTVTGDTLLVGAGNSNNNFVPSVYAKEFGTLNFTLAQRLGPWAQLQFSAKNLTDPVIETVYRSDYIDGDVVRTTYQNGIDLSFAIGGSIDF